MAEAAAKSTWASKIPCRYFMSGFCREASSCRYSHDIGQPQTNRCKFYQMGNCTFGNRCRFEHARKHPESSQAGCSDYATTSLSPALCQGAKKEATSGPKPVMLAKDNNGAAPSRMVTLRKQGCATDCGIGAEIISSPSVKCPEDWVKAAEFIPGQMWKGTAPSSYCDAAQVGIESPADKMQGTPSISNQELCPYAAHGLCHYGENCIYRHGSVCDLCGKAVLDPDNKEQRDKHEEECIKEHEENMELSFAIARSKEKSCGICMETIWEKNPPTERRFGILSNCSHVFCLSCIRKWRSAKQFDNKIVRSCPECRTKSDFITPSKYWVEEKEDKLKLIEGYKVALSTKPCKYFDQGRGECPFNENCFYQHSYPDGRQASPKPVRRRRKADANGDLDIIQQIILWDFLEDQSRRIPQFPVEWDDDLDFFFHLNFWDSSDDESDYSDIGVFGYP